MRLPVVELNKGITKYMEKEVETDYLFIDINEVREYLKQFKENQDD